MITKLFKFWKRSKERKAVKYALKLKNILNELGRVKPSNGNAVMISIYEYSHVPDLLELSSKGESGDIRLSFNNKGEIVK